MTLKGDLFMKTMNVAMIAILGLNAMLGACEFSITNDTSQTVYISMNEKLKDMASEKELQNSSSIDPEDDKKTVKKDLAIEPGSTETTPFTKWFDVYTKNNDSDMYQRAYHVKMKYCSQDNAMTITQIKNHTINMKRFEVTDFAQKPCGCHAQHTQAPIKREAHAPGFEHEHEYRAKQSKSGAQLTNANVPTIQAIDDPFEGKTLLP